jgi:hypothetical protein
MDTHNISYQVFQELNVLRINPVQYTTKLRNHLSKFQGNLIHNSSGPLIRTQEGPPAVQECIDCLLETSPLPEFTWSSELARAAQDHCDDCGPAGVFGHTGADGSTMDDRISRHCNWEITIGENISYGTDTAEDIVIQLMVDDGVPGRGHRINILKPSYRCVGIGFGPHSQMRTICTMDFAGGVSSKSGPQQQGNFIPAARTQNVPEDSSMQTVNSQPVSVYSGIEADPDIKRLMGWQNAEISNIASHQSQCTRISTTKETKTCNGKTVEKITKTITHPDGRVETTQEIKEYDS